MPKLRSGSARMSRTRMRGLRLLNGSWNTTCTRRRMRPQLAGAAGCRCARRRARPRPAVGSISRRIALPTVDLPQPDLADQRQRLAAADVEKLTPSTAWTWPVVPPSRPPRIGKCFLSPLTSSRARRGSCGHPPPSRLGVVAGDAMARRLLLERRAPRSRQQLGRHRAARRRTAQPTIGCAQARHQAGDLRQRARPSPSSDEPSFGTAPSRPRV